MSYFVIYSTLNKENVRKIRTGEACFSSIYNSLHSYKKIYLYIIIGEDFFNKFKYDHYCEADEKTIKEYIDLLNKTLNTNIILKGKKNRILNSHVGIYKCYQIEIPVTSELITKITLNALRYLFEKSTKITNISYYNIVKAFLGLCKCKELDNVSLFNKFLLALTASKSYLDGHSILPIYPIKILSEKQENKILASTSSLDVYSILGEYKVDVDKMQLYNLLSEEKYYEAYKFMEHSINGKKSKELLAVKTEF